MKKFTALFLPALIIIVSAFTSSYLVDWQIADGYAVKFESRPASGVFNKLTGAISFDENNLAASLFNVTIEVNSINTGNGLKNNHAKSSKWFDAEKYPLIKFNSSTVSKVTKGYTVTGMLELHGVKKEITIPFTFINNIFSGSFTINRFDYKIGQGDSSNGGGEIKIYITVPVTKA